MVPPAQRSKIMVIGRTGLLLHGADRPTEGVDFGTSSDTVFELINRAIDAHGGFQRMLGHGSIDYTSLNGIVVNIDIFLFHRFEGSLMPPMAAAITIQHIRVARLDYLVLSKIEAWLSRGDDIDGDKDLEDAKWGISELRRRGESISQVYGTSLQGFAAELKSGSDRGKDLYNRLTQVYTF